MNQRDEFKFNVTPAWELKFQYLMRILLRYRNISGASSIFEQKVVRNYLDHLRRYRDKSFIENTTPVVSPAEVTVFAEAIQDFSDTLGVDLIPIVAKTVSMHKLGGTDTNVHRLKEMLFMKTQRTIPFADIKSLMSFIESHIDVAYKFLIEPHDTKTTESFKGFLNSSLLIYNPTEEQLIDFIKRLHSEFFSIGV